MRCVELHPPQVKQNLPVFWRVGRKVGRDLKKNKGSYESQGFLVEQNVSNIIIRTNHALQPMYGEEATIGRPHRHRQG